MIFPIEDLIKYKGNMYEITCAQARRSYQLSMLKDDEVADCGDKPVSLAARQVYSGQVGFRLDDAPAHMPEELGA
jgi:DNA-directed RNA polymerase subunit omega